MTDSTAKITMNNTFGGTRKAIMRTNILSLGLSPELVDSLSCLTHAPIHPARDPVEASHLLEEEDFTSVVVDASRYPETEAVIEELLSHTSLTTVIVLLCSENDNIDCGKFTDMGVATMLPPFHVDEIAQRLNPTEKAH